MKFSTSSVLLYHHSFNRGCQLLIFSFAALKLFFHFQLNLLRIEPIRFTWKYIELNKYSEKIETPIVIHFVSTARISFLSFMEYHYSVKKSSLMHLIFLSFHAQNISSKKTSISCRKRNKHSVYKCTSLSTIKSFRSSYNDFP